MNLQRQPRIYSIFLEGGIPLCLFFGGAMSLLFSEGHAAEMFKCRDSTGTVVFTDTPAQLENCTPLVQDNRSDSKPIIKTPPPQRYQQSPSTRPVPTQSRPSPSFDEVDEEEEDDLLDDDEKETEDAPDSPKTVTVRLTKIGGSFVTQVRLNRSVDAHLIVDTGATMTVLSYDVAANLGLLSGSDNDISTVNTAGGSVQVSMATLEHVQVGQAEANNVSVAIHDLPDGISGVSGLLGMSFLNNFLVTLDSTQSLLHLKTRN